MKNKWYILLAVILCVALLGGCQKPADTAGTTNKGNSEQEGQNLENESIAPDIDDTFLAERIAWKENDNLFEIPAKWLDGVCQAELHRMGNNILILYSTFAEGATTSTTDIKLVSLETGEFLYEQQLEELSFASAQVLENGVAINDLGSGKCYLLDENLQILNSYELPQGTFCLDPTGKYAYIFSYDNGIQKKELATGTQTVLLDNASDLYMGEGNDKEAAFTYTNSSTLLREIGILDLATGKIRIVASGLSYDRIDIGDEVWLGNIISDKPMYVFYDGQKQKQFFADISNIVELNAASGHLIIHETTETGDAIMSAYDKQGDLISRCNIEGLAKSVAYDFAWYEEYNGYVFFMTDQAGQDHLMFWDLSLENEEGHLLMEDM